MTYKKWEKKFKKSLKELSAGERDNALSFYREMYNDKKCENSDENSIVESFGSPEQCAKKVLDENGIKSGDLSSRGKHSAAEIIGLVFMTLILIIPLMGAALGIIVSMASICVSGAACVVGGIGMAFYYPFTVVTASGAFAGIGAGLAVSGIGFLLFVAFYFATKYTAIWLWKAFKAVYVRR